MITKLKICGITSPKDAAAVLEAGADFIGIVHYPKSPRHCSIEKICGLLDAAEPLLNERRNKIQETVLVVADAEIAEIEKILDAADNRFDYVQIHRDLTDAEFCEFYIRLHNKTHLIRVVRSIESAEHIIENAFRCPQPLFYLLEISQGALPETLPGGNGKKWDWSLAEKFCKRYSTFIAGGIEAEDIDGITDKIAPFGIDLSSGVEISPGVKSIEKVRDVVSRVEGKIN